MILLLNDDGIAAPGYRALYRALRALGRGVLAVAPSRERSGRSQAITLDRALSVTPRHEAGFFGFAVDGTPADCAKVALTALCQEPPELVVSGINDGPNVGRSIFYSGTLGAAMECAVAGCAALAVSRFRGAEVHDDAAEFAAHWARRLLDRPELRGTVANLNLPAEPAATWKPLRTVRHGHGGFHERHLPERDADGRIAWRLHGDWAAQANADGDDAEALSAKHPTLSLLRPDLNAPDAALRALLEPA